VHDSLAFEPQTRLGLQHLLLPLQVPVADTKSSPQLPPGRQRFPVVLVQVYVGAVVGTGFGLQQYLPVAQVPLPGN